MTRVRVKHALRPALALALVLPTGINSAETQDQTEGALPVCDRDQAILRVERQVSEQGPRTRADDPDWPRPLRAGKANVNKVASRQVSPDAGG